MSLEKIEARDALAQSQPSTDAGTHIPSSPDVGASLDWVLVPREPTAEMLKAAWNDTVKATPEERMALELCDNRQAFEMKMARRYAAMLAAAKAEPRDGPKP